MTFIDLFAGIGGIRYGLEQAGMKCVGYIENDKYARLSYEAMYNTKDEWTEWDITDVEANNIPKADLWAFGFPCTDISVAGKQKGLQGERSGLFYEVIRLLQGKSAEDRPKWLLIENVKNLLSIDGGRGFTEVLFEISQAGYDAEWHLINSKDYGVPQNRERVFIIGHLRRDSGRQLLPVARAGEQAVNEKEIGIDLIHNDPKERKRIVSPDGLSKCLTATDYKEPPRVAIPVLTPDRVNKRQNGRRFKEDGDPMFTLTTQDKHGVLLYDGEEYKIRRLTPRECFRLQGFPDVLFDRAEKVCSNSQLYKQAGNAVTTTVAFEIGKAILNENE